MPRGFATAGALDRRVEILERAAARGKLGSAGTAWTAVATVWARIDVQESALIFQTAEFMSKVTYRITLRWRSDLRLDASKRLRYTEPATGTVHLYEIKAPLNTGAANRDLVLLCYELGGEE